MTTRSKQVRWQVAGRCLSLLVVMLHTSLFAIRSSADEPVLTLETGGHTANCKRLDFTPDGRTLISLGDDKVVRLWAVSDPASPRLDRSLRLQIGPGSEGMLYAGAVSPDGRWLAVGGYGFGPDNPIHLLDLTSGEVAAVLRGHSNVINGLAFSPDGAWLASASGDQTLRVWDVAPSVAAFASTRATQTDVTSAVLKGHSDDVYGVAWLAAGWPPRPSGAALSLQPSPQRGEGARNADGRGGHPTAASAEPFRLVSGSSPARTTTPGACGSGRRTARGTRSPHSPGIRTS